jgi:hypothetical protein
VKGVGLASPLGGAVQAAAAFRAGITRIGPAPDVEVMFPGDEEPQSVGVHALPSATFGYSGAGRLASLLSEAIVDLAASVDLTQLGPDTGFFLTLPDPQARGFTLGRNPEDDDPEEADARVAALGERIVALAGPAAGADLRRFKPQFLAGGHVAFAKALAAAQAAIASRQVKSALVAAVDSLASPDALDLFASEGRVKNGENPTGFTPGEAAAVFLLEPPPRTPPGKGPAVLVQDPVFGQDPRPFGSDVPSDGRVLADCLARAVGPLPPGAPAPLLISDHDGETHRARELGMLQQRLVALKNRRLANATTWLPASAFGNTGAASGAVALLLALRALVRGYAPAPGLTLLSSDDSGARAALNVFPAPTSGGRPA